MKKVHLCVLLIPIHQTTGRDVLARASVSRLIMSPCAAICFSKHCCKALPDIGNHGLAGRLMSSHKYQGELLFFFFFLEKGMLTPVHDVREIYML